MRRQCLDIRPLGNPCTHSGEEPPPDVGCVCALCWTSYYAAAGPRAHSSSIYSFSGPSHHRFTLAPSLPIASLLLVGRGLMIVAGLFALPLPKRWSSACSHSRWPASGLRQMHSCRERYAISSNENAILSSTFKGDYCAKDCCCVRTIELLDGTQNHLPSDQECL
jgi:hypothetical protein